MIQQVELNSFWPLRYKNEKPQSWRRWPRTVKAPSHFSMWHAPRAIPSRHSSWLRLRRYLIVFDPFNDAILRATDHGQSNTCDFQPPSTQHFFLEFTHQWHSPPINENVLGKFFSSSWSLINRASLNSGPGQSFANPSFEELGSLEGGVLNRTLKRSFRIAYGVVMADDWLNSFER
ncbi:hypothetical protein BDZ45DRAFT_464972 [Acephala macrosclerotiorum]|nr:hypothetical protein BDZ45DRAFT_464972 [Acephala macrosclerotiorum]